MRELAHPQRVGARQKTARQPEYSRRQQRFNICFRVCMELQQERCNTTITSHKQSIVHSHFLIHQSHRVCLFISRLPKFHQIFCSLEIAEFRSDAQKIENSSITYRTIVCLILVYGKELYKVIVQGEFSYPDVDSFCSFNVREIFCHHNIKKLLYVFKINVSFVHRKKLFHCRWKRSHNCLCRCHRQRKFGLQLWSNTELF